VKDDRYTQRPSESDAEFALRQAKQAEGQRARQQEFVRLLRQKSPSFPKGTP
jgi:hypothetical protein